MGFYLKSKVIEGSQKGKSFSLFYFLIFGHFFTRCTFLRLWHFFLPSGYPINAIFSVAVHIYKIHVFDEPFFLLTIRIRMVTKLFWVVACCEELTPITMHDISKEWSCGVMWQIKYMSPPTEDVSTPHEQGAGLMKEAAKHDHLITWLTWCHVIVWKIYTFSSRLLTLGGIFIMPTLKSSPTSCFCYNINFNITKY